MSIKFYLKRRIEEYRKAVKRFSLYVEEVLFQAYDNVE